MAKNKYAELEELTPEDLARLGAKKGKRALKPGVDKFKDLKSTWYGRMQQRRIERELDPVKQRRMMSNYRALRRFIGASKPYAIGAAGIGLGALGLYGYKKMRDAERRRLGMQYRPPMRYRPRYPSSYMRYAPYNKVLDSMDLRKDYYTRLYYKLHRKMPRRIRGAIAATKMRTRRVKRAVGAYSARLQSKYGKLPKTAQKVGRLGAKLGLGLGGFYGYKAVARRGKRKGKRLSPLKAMVASTLGGPIGTAGYVSGYTSRLPRKTEKLMKATRGPFDPRDLIQMPNWMGRMKGSLRHMKRTAKKYVPLKEWRQSAKKKLDAVRSRYFPSGHHLTLGSAAYLGGTAGYYGGKVVARRKRVKKMLLPCHGPRLVQKRCGTTPFKRIRAAVAGKPGVYDPSALAAEKIRQSKGQAYLSRRIASAKRKKRR